MGCMPTWCRKRMSWAKLRCKAASTMALPPYLTTTREPAKRSSHGRAWISTPALSAGVNEDVIDTVVSGRRSCRVGAVFVDVVVGEVVGPHRHRLSAAGVEVDVDSYFACCGQIDHGTVFAEPGLATDLHAVDPHIEVVGLERCHRFRHGTHRGNDAAPVGVVAVDGGLDQIRAGDRASYGQGGGFTARPTHGDRDVVGGTFRVGHELAGQISADLLQGLRKVLRVG